MVHFENLGNNPQSELVGQSINQKPPVSPCKCRRADALYQRNRLFISQMIRIPDNNR